MFSVTEMSTWPKRSYAYLGSTPVVPMMLAQVVVDDGEGDPRFALSRFSSPPTGGWREKWS